MLRPPMVLRLLSLLFFGPAFSLAATAQSISFTPTWVQAASGGPSARTGSAMAYDAATGQIVLFGGFNDGSPLADTWTWNGTAWTNVTPPSPAPSPSARGSAAMAYDAATGQVVLFGGFDVNNYLGDTWTWNGTAWTNVTPPSPALSPAARDDAAMAYDAATGQVVLFGGYGNTILGDTWTWNGTAWTNVTPQSPAPSPSARYSGAMAYDAATGQVVFFGGSPYASDTWTWNGTAWTDVTPQSPAPSPPGRFGATMAYDAATGQVALFGGHSNPSVQNDTWTWNGTGWTELSVVSSPGARQSASMAYDAATGQVVLFGGVGSNLFGDTQTLQLGAVNLGTANVCPNGAASPSPCSQTATVNFTVGASNVTVDSVNVLTQGAPNLDFTATATTCSGALNANTACTVTVKFAPTHPGPRLGGISLTDSSGNILGGIPLSGFGSGPQVIFPPGVIGALGSGYSYPDGVAVDGSGNVYVADFYNNAIKEIVAVNGSVPASNPTIKTLGSGFSYPAGVAVDGSGNVYVADDGNSAVKEIVAVNGSIPASNPTINTLGSGFSHPYAVAVDGSGNVYVADTFNSAVKEIVAVNGSIPASNPTINTLGSGFKVPEGVAVDGSGNVYVANSFYNTVQEIVAVNGSIPANNPTINTLGGGFYNPTGVAVDGSGNVYVADARNNAVKEIVAVNGSIPASNPTIKTLGSGFNAPEGVTVDGSGNIYVADTDNNAVKEINLSTPPTVVFATSTLDGTTDSTDGIQTVTVQNIGNQPLVFAVPNAGLNPSVAANFTLGTNSSANCPSIASTSSAGTLAAGASCTLPVGFAPVANTPSGTVNGQVVLTDNALNAAPAVQTIALQGTAMATTASATNSTVVASPSPAVAGSTATVTVTVEDAGGNAINGATASFSSTSTTAVFGTPSVNGNVITVSMTDTAVETAPISVTLGGAAGGMLSGSEQFVAPNFLVTTLTDHIGSTANCVAGATDNTGGNGGCNLRDAFAVANVLNGVAVTINFWSGIPALATATQASPAKYSVATYNALSVTSGSSLTVNGPTDANGNNLLAIDGGGSVEIFDIDTSVGVILNHLILQNGSTNGFGGGIYISRSGVSLTVNSCTLSRNTAGSGGGGLHIDGGTVTVSNSTFSSNAANGSSGGGINVNGGTVTVSNSTFYGNSAGLNSGYGAGINVNGGTVMIVNSTFANNLAGSNSSVNGTLTLSNSIVSDGISGNYTNAGGNLISKTGLNLSALGYYGGPTQTMLPLPGSPAICAAAVSGVPVTPSLSSNQQFTDERGATHGTSYCTASQLDAGAVQTRYAMGFNTAPSSVSPATVMSPSPAVTVTENGNALTAGSASVSVTDTAGDLKTTPQSATTSNGVATFGALSFKSRAIADSLTASLTLNASISISQQSGTFDVDTFTSLAITGAPASAFVNIPFQITVTANDPQGNADKAYTGTVSFTSTDAAASLPSTYAFTAADAGTHVFTVTLFTLGPQTITATDSAANQSANTGNIVVSLPTVVVTTALDDPSPVDQCGSAPTNGPTACRAQVLLQEITNCPMNNSPASNNCSLRDALATAGVLGSGNITFDPTAFATAKTISVAKFGTLNIPTYTTIVGPTTTSPGTVTPLVTIDGGGQAEIFSIGSGQSGNSISGLTLSKGSGAFGGAISSSSPLSIANSVFTGNFGTTTGGAIYTYTASPLSVINSTFTGNSSTGNGGAITSTSALTASDSTFSSNLSNAGGAIDAISTLTVSNSTFSGNSSTYGGGALDAQGALTVSNSTFSGNGTSGLGGAIFAGQALTVSDSIFTGDSAVGNSGIYASLGTGVVTNIVYNGDTFTQLTLTNSINADPKLTALGNYGGPTQTMVPLPNSPAICAGTQPALNGTPLTTDQRGVAISGARYGQSACYDVGAVQTEYSLGSAFTTQPPSLVPSGTAITPNPAVTVTENGIGFVGATVTMSAANGKLSGTNPVLSGAGGLTTFTNLSISGAGSSDTLTAALVPLNVSVTSSAFTSLTLSAPSNLNGQAGVTYSDMVTASNGTSPYSYGINGGALPGGLSLNTSTGAISGTPTAVGNFTVSVLVTDKNGGTATAKFTLSISAPSIVVGPSTLPSLTVGLTPTVVFSAQGGTSAYGYKVSPGTLPAGLQLNQATGAITGMPTSAGPYSFTITATDSTTGANAPYSGQQAYSGNVAKGTAQVSFTVGTLTYSGSPQGPSVSTQPLNLALTYVYTGTGSTSYSSSTAPTNAGTYAVTATVSDTNYQGSAGPTAFAIGKAGASIQLGNLTPTYTALPQAVTATTLPGGLAGVTFSYTGTGGTTYGPTATAPTAAGNYLVTATLTNPNYTGVQTNALTIATATLAISANSVGRSYGVANPTFTGSVGATQGNDSFVEGFSTSATMTSAPGQYAIVPSVTGANLSDYTVVATNGTLTVSKANSITALNASSLQITPVGSVTLTATVSSTTTGTPGGTVVFYDGANAISGNVALSSGQTQYTVQAASLAPGVQHAFSAQYSGDPDFNNSASFVGAGSTVTVLPNDFTLTLSPGQSFTVIPGQSISYSFQITPTYALYPGVVTFSAAGLPPGAIAVFTPASIAANGGPQTVTLTISTVLAQNHLRGRGMLPIAFGLLLLPVMGVRRLRKRLRTPVGVLLLAMGLAAAFGVTGCSAPNGFFGQAPQNYTVTVTATAGPTAHTSNFTLNVQ